ncbi:PREDICTED: uncharacterized protein LOC105459821 [Wasmannia auropunctata]|uniref:uncharacterized protein LOC105459821 n=1 Tax=Wasmannia auropunctata TaxID=64793 RepID=UPI0005EF7672|nr:PREDICTED: uncharacterized protein LOC105459821 [Wasmannia auropunctata]XP_011704418.1 PREDICTED: uncharacterized protein LOC105459821 [Wasmannia auropunctata]XP_011704419.1 PREDICTED: uncharacterized protein LOC105459821 [Wasmannia auropunctata]XP_011704420.1 PREDICTED: uncharacterized protein LOC105459821 [Wasmannia auropunctata]
MQFRQPAIWLFKLLSIGFTYAGISEWDACSGRLERALDALHRDSTRRNKLDEEEAGTLYQRELHSAPLEMSVSRMAVKLPENPKESGSHWARVEQCVYDPDRNSLRTRVVFNDLSVSGMVSVMPRNHRALISAESCRMTLRLRRAGIDFLTSPIARGRGQMRIRTESSFLEPRFASIYAYGCRSTRIDKQIKRQDKWPPYHLASVNKITPTLSLPLNDKYDAAEPRQLAGNAEEMDIVIPNESRHSRYLHAPETNIGVWRKNSWITKLSRRKRSMARYARTAMVITPRDFADALINKHKSTERSANFTKILNLTDEFRNEDPPQNVSREVRELVVDDNFDNLFPDVDSEDPNRSWQSKEYITREMEDVFLQGASQALTRYIERQLHPAIKETLMLSMGYTISYG